MKDLSSKIQMENKLNILSKIQKVETPIGMYENILANVNHQKKNTISISWIRSAAAAVIILVAAETYLLTSTSFSKQSESTASIESIIPSDNNILYYE